MEVNYKWEILQLDCSPQVGEHQDYVIGIHCSLIGEYNGFYSNYPWLQTLTVSLDNPNYKPYNELTEEDVIKWIESSIIQEQYDNMKIAIAQAIEDKINPPIIVLPLPWANN